MGASNPRTLVLQYQLNNQLRRNYIGCGVANVRRSHATLWSTGLSCHVRGSRAARAKDADACHDRRFGVLRVDRLPRIFLAPCYLPAVHRVPAHYARGVLLGVRGVEAQVVVQTRQTANFRV